MPKNNFLKKRTCLVVARSTSYGIIYHTYTLCFFRTTARFINYVFLIYTYYFHRRVTAALRKQNAFHECCMSDGSNGSDAPRVFHSSTSAMPDDCGGGDRGTGEARPEDRPRRGSVLCWRHNKIRSAGRVTFATRKNTACSRIIIITICVWLLRWRWRWYY